jgi:hypothetical protein
MLVQMFWFEKGNMARVIIFKDKHMAVSLGTPAFYRLAGQSIFIDPEIPAVQPFRLEGQAFPTPQIPADLMSMAQIPPAALIEGWLADQILTVSLWRNQDGTLMEIPTAGYFWSRADGKAICQVSQAPEAGPRFLAEALLGPPLVLALAWRDKWCLHASAALFQDKMIAFLGESGGGKSTLAAYLSQNPNWHLVSDDILPVSKDPGGLVAWPRFPQLKLPEEAQPGPSLPEELPLGKLCVLSNTDADERPDLKRLSASLAVPFLLAHTAGTRLFDPQLLEKHLTFCIQAAEGVHVYRLGYPRRLEALPEIHQLLEGLC